MSRHNYYNNDPRVITARFSSTCAETGKEIKKGEECIYYPTGKKVFCMDSKQARDFESYMFDLNCLGCNY